LKNNDNEHKRSGRKQILNGIVKFSEIAFTIVANVLLGVLIGRFLDQWLNTSPWFLLFFSILGVISAIYSLFSMF